MTKKTNSGLKIICLNRKASFNYFFEDFLEAGIVLKGSEIKSIRSGKVNIADSYAIEKNGEIYLINSQISSTINEIASSVTPEISDSYLDGLIQEVFKAVEDKKSEVEKQIKDKDAKITRKKLKAKSN